MVDDEAAGFAAHSADGAEESACDVGGVAVEGQRLHVSLLEDESHVVGTAVGSRVDVGDVEFAFEAEEPWVVEQSAVHAAAVVGIVVHDFQFPCCKGGLCHEVFEHLPVLDFRNPDDGGTGLHAVGTELGKDLREVLQFGAVLHAVPCVGTVWQEFVVVLSGCVDGVKKVFEVVECHAVECQPLLLLLGTGGWGGKKVQAHEGQADEKEFSHGEMGCWDAESAVRNYRNLPTHTKYKDKK